MLVARRSAAGRTPWLRRQSTASSVPAPVRWGFLGCGRIASDFINALKSAPGFELAACASRSIASAEHFAKIHGVDAAYGSYAELVADDNVDIIYLSTIHHLHHRHAMLCLEAGKNVLVEKPIALTQEHAIELATTARERKLFLMEGMWTRFFPVIVCVHTTAYYITPQCHTHMHTHACRWYEKRRL